MDWEDFGLRGDEESSMGIDRDRRGTDGGGDIGRSKSCDFVLEVRVTTPEALSLPSLCAAAAAGREPITLAR